MIFLELVFFALCFCCCRAEVSAEFVKFIERLCRRIAVWEAAAFFCEFLLCFIGPNLCVSGQLYIVIVQNTEDV